MSIAAIAMVILPIEIWAKFRHEISYIAGGTQMWEMIFMMISMAGTAALGISAPRLVRRQIAARSRRSRRTI